MAVSCAANRYTETIYQAMEEKMGDNSFCPCSLHGPVVTLCINFHKSLQTLHSFNSRCSLSLFKVFPSNYRAVEWLA